jgi:Tfp pilus assembly protein PilF
MSLLMDALRKAEMAKQKSPPEAETSFADLGAELSLEPVEPPTERVEPSTDMPAAPTRTEVGAVSGLPALPDRLEELDDQFARPITTETTPPAQEPLGADSYPPRSSAPKSPPQEELQLTPAPLRRNIDPPSTSASPPPSPATPASSKEPTDVASRSEQAAIKNLFDAKAPPRAKSNRRFLISIGAASLVAALGIGGYFWWQLQPKSSMVALRPAAISGANHAINPAPPPAIAPPASVTPAPTQATGGTTTAAQQTPAPSAVPPAPTLAAPAAARPASSQAKSEDDDIEAPAVSRKAATRQADSSSRQLRKPDPEPPATGKTVRVSKTPVGLNPLLSNAYDAFGRGELASARRDYETILKAEPQNTDALHGMAAIALREKRSNVAEDYFQRILVANPQDPIAAAGLANLHGTSDLARTESRMKGIAATQPESAAPLFALGNTQAAQGRWNEAQQSYFKAYSLEPANPDILFNLAISLEQLRQGKLAGKYYSLALEAAEKSPPGFELETVRARLKVLQQ